MGLFDDIFFCVYDCAEEMIRGLNQVSWERIDVSFVKSRQRYIAHSTIQVKPILMVVWNILFSFVS